MINRELHRDQAGQHVILFSMVFSLMLLVIGAIGDVDVRAVHYDKIDAAAFQAATGGAGMIDRAAYDRGVVVLDTAAAIGQCRQLAHLNAPFVPYRAEYNPSDPRTDANNRIRCAIVGGNVEAQIVDRGEYVLGILGNAFLIEARQTASPAYGVSAPCNPGSPTC